jgi:hypothetical protein
MRGQGRLGEDLCGSLLIMTAFAEQLVGSHAGAGALGTRALVVILKIALAKLVPTQLAQTILPGPNESLLFIRGCTTGASEDMLQCDLGPAGDALQLIRETQGLAGRVQILTLHGHKAHLATLAEALSLAVMIQQTDNAVGI